MSRTSTQDGGYHVPVLRDEVVARFSDLPSGIVIDGTYGGGGHTSVLLSAYPHLRIIGIDRDVDAIRRAPDEPRLRIVEANFADLADVLVDWETRRWIDEPGDDGPSGRDVVGVLLDLGVSSHQLDQPERGFSFHRSGPLDMRMGRSGLTAADIVNEWSDRDLAAIFRRYGEERHAGAIARRIVADRPFDDTASLAAAIADAVPAAARRQGHPARRTFQALRIAVNDELGAVAQGVDAAIDAVTVGGRVVVIAYHSLEDRIVKRRFVAGSQDCTCPPGLPVCACGTDPELRRLTRRAVRPTEQEIAENPRSRSARLRAVEKART